MTDISATSFFRQSAADGGMSFEHEETDTGGSKWPTRFTLKALHPETGEQMGFLTYRVPARKADKIAVDRLETHPDHQRKGVGSALMDEMQRRHPGTPIDHGDRTPDGKAWWKSYTDGKRVQRGRTIASLADAFRTTASHPRAEVPPEQAEALEHPSFSEYRRRSLELAKNPTPGTMVWRGEARSGEPHDTLRSSGVGMHWTVNPDSVLVPRPHESERRVLWQGRIEDPASQTIPRSHPSWGGRTGHSMDHEAEVRFQPGSKVHIEGAYVWHGQGDPEGHPVPRRPERTHPDWKWHPVGEHAEVRNLGHIDYGHHETPASDAHMPPPWHGADPHTVVQHEHDAGNHHSAHPGGTYDDIDWDAPCEHVDGHSNAVMTDMALKDGYIQPHSLSHEDASEWLRWHPDRAGIEQRHGGKTASLHRTAAVEEGDDVPSRLLNPHGHHIRARVGNHRNVEMVPRDEIARYASQETDPEHTKTVSHHIASTGEMEPLLLHYHPASGEAYLGEGNHRLRAAGPLQMDHLPVRVQRNNYGLPGPGVKVPQDHPGVASGEHIPHDIKPSDIGLTTVHKPTMSEWDKKSELAKYRLLHGSKTASTKPCPCCGGTGEHGTGFECYHCDGGRTVPADSPDDVTCDGALPDGGHGKTATYTEDPLPSEVRSWRNTEWDVPHQVDQPIHRGLTIPLTPEDHALIHDHQTSPGKRAAHIVKLVSKDGNLGRHWTLDPDVASHYSTSTVGEMKDHPHVLAVSLHAHPPAAEHIEHDPVELGRMQVKAHSVEKEIPLKDGAPVRMYGVSWHNPRDHTQSGQYIATAQAKGITRNASADALDHLQQAGYNTDGWSKWQQGHCGTYACALIAKHPHLRFGVMGEEDEDGWRPTHYFAHDDHHAYDSAGKHPLPYHGIDGHANYSELDSHPDDWGLPHEESGPEGPEPHLAEAAEHAERHQIVQGRYGPHARRTASADTPVPDNTKSYEHEHDWLPRDHFFAPGEKGLDPRLFDGDRMRPEVRQELLSLLNAFWAPKYGDSWQSWARVYLAGSEASHWYGNNDLDILIGVDHEALHHHVDHFTGEPDAAIDEKLTDELRHGLNDDHRMLPGPDGKDTGPWENTWYVNPDSYDIRVIKPYAAYDITRDEWAVKPVEVPDDFGPEKLPESTWDVLDALTKLIKAIAELPDGTREREGAALYDYLHADRHSAFGPEGSGLYDPANAVWKALDKAPGKPLQQLIDWKHAHDGTAATDLEAAA